LEITQAQEFDGTNLFDYPLGGADAFNWQGAAIWRYGMDGQLHASVSARSRFAGIWELYSTRFGTAIANPDLGPERARNFEIGWQSRLGESVQVSATAFYSDVFDLIQTVEVSPGMTQTQNVGDGEFYGFEAAFDAALSPEFSFGGNYSYIEREVTDALQPNLEVTGVPEHKAFLYAAWRPIPALTLTPSLEIASDRWSDMSTNPAQAIPYIRTGAYALVNAQAEYAITENLEFAAGVRNLLDVNYELAWGYPQAGRNYYFKLRATY
jgi:iron complex outermembrane receptor protein